VWLVARRDALDLSAGARTLGFRVTELTLDELDWRLQRATPELLLLDLELEGARPLVERLAKWAIPAVVVGPEPLGFAPESLVFLARPFDARLLAVHARLAIAVSGSRSNLRSSEERLAIAEVALRARDRHQEALLAASPVGVCEMDLEGRCTYVNETWCELSGLTAEEAVGDGHRRALHPESRAAFDEAWRRSIAEGRNFRLEYRLLRPDGQERWVLGQSVPLPVDNEIIGFVGTVTDLTARRRSEEELARREELLRVSQALARVGCWEWDASRERLSWSEEMFRLHAEDPVTFVPDRARVRALYEPDCRAWFDQMLSGERPEDSGELRLLRGGHVHSVSFRTYADGRVVGANLDVTEQRQREAALELADFGIEHAVDGFHMVDESGRFVSVNGASCRLLGYARHELLTMSVSDIDPAFDDEVWPAHWAELRSKGALSFETEVRTKTGERVPVEIAANLLSFEGRQFDFAVMRDLRERRRAEEQRVLLEGKLRQAQKMESLGTLAGGIAHDFNNLLAAITCNLELAEEAVAAGEPLEMELQEIRMATTRATDLVRRILAFSRKQPARRAVARLDPIVEEVARLLRAGIPAAIELVTEIGERVPPVHMDSTQIHQVLMNLGTNAWQAIAKPKGTIRLGLEAVTVRGAHPVPPGHYARVRVGDDGVGMSPSTIERIFEPFFTTKGVGVGTGLGLAVVHGIVAEHGGVIVVDSAEERGAVFDVYLPAADKDLSRSEQPPSRKHTGSGRVLLVDDEEAVLRAGKRVIEMLGYDVTACGSALDALAAVQADPARFDLVVTDLSMPDLSGLELALRLRELRGDLPIVMVTGRRSEEESDLAAAGICVVLDKPYSSEELSAALRSARGG